MQEHDTSQSAADQLVSKPSLRARLAGFKFLLLLAVVSVTATAIYAVPSVTAAFGLATTRTNEPFTELYFTSPTRLSKAYNVDTPQTVRFSIHNAEGRDLTYRYAVYVDGVQTTPTRTALILDTATLRTFETISVISTKPRLEVTVKLLNTNQSIHYWTEKEQ